MAAINTSQQLAVVRSQIDSQQQIVSMLELELQKAILGSSSTNLRDIIEHTPGRNSIEDILGNSARGIVLFNAFQQGVADFSMDAPADQSVLRQMLYQSRAMLGELRVEEQQWNQEVTEEKARRKDLGDFAKG
jgi:hypothetical protein